MIKLKRINNKIKKHKSSCLLNNIMRNDNDFVKMFELTSTELISLLVKFKSKLGNHNDIDWI